MQPVNGRLQEMRRWQYILSYIEADLTREDISDEYRAILEKSLDRVVRALKALEEEDDPAFD